MKSISYAPGINFFKLVLPESHRNLIHSEISDEDLTGWSKILSDVNKNQSILKSIIKGLWGGAGPKDSILNTLDIHDAIKKDPKVVQFFVGTPTNKELTKLAGLFQSCLPNHIIRVLSGAEDATNATSESIVKEDIKRCKEENKDGVVILSKDMGSRSFSVSETDAVVLMYDNGSVSSLIQKISRALTGGLDYNGVEKTNGNVISLSLDPNRVDAVDIYVVEEAQKNKTKSESFLSAVKRIRKSVNIFAFDENNDPKSLLDKDEYYAELIEKFSFEKLKNSQINIIPLISDGDLRNSLLEINSSELNKNEKKVTQLKGKGKKFVDNGNDSGDSDNEKEEVVDKLDINLLRQAVLTINNSILSIIGIDDSIGDKSKSFRSVLKSIDSELEKVKEFYDLYGIRPSVVIKLMDKGVINEQIIDICISKF
jgi:dihydroxyacetone kinase DhaKLM complex PTS-EIIA-like component DhaM